MSLFSRLSVDHDRDGAVVDQRHLHVCPEIPGLDRLAEIQGELAQERFVKRKGELGPGSATVGGAIPFPGAGEQSELADHQKLATSFLHGAIHDALLVVEYP